MCALVAELEREKYAVTTRQRAARRSAPRLADKQLRRGKPEPEPEPEPEPKPEPEPPRLSLNPNPNPRAGAAATSRQRSGALSSSATRDAARTGATRVSAAARRRGSSYITRRPSRRAANIASTTSPCAAAPTTRSPPKRISAGISSAALAIRASTSSGPDTKDRAPYRQERSKAKVRARESADGSRQRPGSGCGGRRIARPNRSISLRNLCGIDRRARLRSAE
jgi:hypothetical protein